MTRYGQEVVNDRSLESLGSQLRLIGHLCIIVVEVLGELHLGLLQQFHVTHATYHHAHLHGVVGLHLGLVECGRNRVLAYSTREARRALGQRIDLNGDAGSLDFLLHLHIARTSVEESLEGIDVTVLLHDNTLVGNAWNLEFSRHLREHDILLPCHRAVGLAIQRLDVELLLLRQRHLAGIETLQVSHLTIQLGQSYQRVHLISQQDGLLLADMLLRGSHLDKQVAARNG